MPGVALPPSERIPEPFVVAAIHAAPAFLDTAATLERTGGLVAEAASHDARLVVFGESFVPGFPLWALVLPPVDQHVLFRRFYEQSILVPGPATRQIGELARRHRIYLSVGVTERSPVSLGAIYNANLLFGPDGALLAHHRKIVPTWAEKLVWTSGDASGLRPTVTELGAIGALICGENGNPLARYALLAQGEQVHLASYPPSWPFRRTSDRAAYRRWIELRAGAHSFEGKVFTVVAGCALDDEAITVSAAGDSAAEATLRSSARSCSFVFDPNVELCSEVVTETGIAYAEINLAQSIEAKLSHDIIGNYQRFDLFQLQLDRRPQRPIWPIEPADYGPGHDRNVGPDATVVPDPNLAEPAGSGQSPRTSNS